MTNIIWIIVDFKMPGLSSLTNSTEAPALPTSLLESEDGPSTNVSQAKEEVKSNKTEYDEVKS